MTEKIHFYITYSRNNGTMRVLCQAEPMKIIGPNHAWSGVEIQNGATAGSRITCLTCLKAHIQLQENKLAKLRERLALLESGQL